MTYGLVYLLGLQFMFSTGQAESIFHVLVHGVCTSDMRKHARAAEAQPCVCTPLCPCSCTSTPVEAEGRATAGPIVSSVPGCWPAYPSAKWCIRLNNFLKEVWNPCFSSKHAGNYLLAHWDPAKRLERVLAPQRNEATCPHSSIAFNKMSNRYKASFQMH